MAIIEHNGLFLLDGKFWIVQRADLARRDPGFGTGQGPKTDSFGNPRLEWPARSVYFDHAQAQAVAQEMAGKYKDYPYVVMEATHAFGAVQPAIPVVKRRL